VYELEPRVVRFSPRDLRDAGIDPVSVLDGYRAEGLRASAANGELPEDPGELVLAMDAAGLAEAQLQLDPVAGPPPALDRVLPAGARLGREWARRFPPDVPPETHAYDATHRALISSLLDDESWQALFAAGSQLPLGLGAGYDERVVEYPWLFSRGLSGRVLDAGSVLNHRHVIERLEPRIDGLTIVTLAPEPASFTELGVSYLYEDLRELPFRDGWFDEIVCLSTLEHVGMDNSGYGAEAPRAEDPRAEAAAALRELLRVVRPGGRVHVSVPFGRREDHGWLRQLDRADADDLFSRAGARRRQEVVFRHSSRGWRRAATRRAGRGRYQAGPGRARDRAVAARGVLCATIFT
jgi:SAM-dependent methyltransferase